MANRVLVGKMGSDFGIKVSKEGFDVTTTADKNLLFDSTSRRTGLVYAGATGLTLNDSADNYLTTGSKTSLGYPPLVIFSEKNNGNLLFDDFQGDVSQMSIWKTTTSTVTPCTAQTAAVSFFGGSNIFTGTLPSDGRGYDGVNSSNENAINVSYFVLRIPCAWGYMNDTYFGS